MEPTSHYTPSSKLEKRIPTAAYQLAVSYHLGTPIKEYRDNLVPRLVILGLMFDVLGLFFMLFTVNTIVAFYFGNKQGGNNIFSIPFISTTTSSNNSIHTDQENYIYVYWLGLALALIFLTLGYILLTRGFKQFLRKSRSYLFTEGFMVLEQATIVLIIRWDRITQIWCTYKVLRGVRSAYVFPNYSIVDVDGKEWEIENINLLKAIERRLAQ